MKFFISILCIIIFIGCSNGKIEEKTNSNCPIIGLPNQGIGAYLINRSRGKRMEFTIKSYPVNKTDEIKNAIYILEPGAQTFIGCISQDYNFHYYRYEIAGEREVK